MALSVESCLDFDLSSQPSKWGRRTWVLGLRRMNYIQEVSLDLEMSNHLVDLQEIVQESVGWLDNPILGPCLAG